MKLRIALVGAGNVARSHLMGLAESDIVEVAGILDPDQARAREKAEAFGIPRLVESWAELLADASIPCVGLLLPHDLHESFAIEALAAGKHVVCEKPLATTIASCDRMLAAAESHGRKLFAVQNRIFSRAYEAVKEIVTSGAIGDVLIAQTNGFEGPGTIVGRQPWMTDHRGGGGVLITQAVHAAYALRYLVGDVKQVSCLFAERKVVPMTAEDSAIVTLRFANGAIGEMTSTFTIAHGPFDHSITLHGTDGYVTVGAIRGDARRRFGVRAISPSRFGDKELHDVEILGDDLGHQSFGRMWDEYARNILDGSPTRCTGIDGKRAVEVILAAYASNASHRVVTLPLA
jgi:UDP-N-acetyl-2-amino-2-deoxyglucuronate dehydrogenase